MAPVSVIIPSYNHRGFIRAALESLAAQTFADFEVVIVDDGSTDGSPETIREYLRHSPLQATLYTQPNGGAHAAIEQGIALAKGRHLAILNSDDEFHPDRLRTLLAIVPPSGPYLAFSEFTFIDAEGQVIHSNIPNRVWYWRLLEEHAFSPGVGFTILKGNISISTSNFLFSREMHGLAGGFRPYRTAHDMDFLLRCIFHCEPVFVRQSLLNYRLHSYNTIEANRLLERHEVGQLFLDYVKTATATAPWNPRAPASVELAIYSDYALRQRTLWFEPTLPDQVLKELEIRAATARAFSSDADALMREVERLATTPEPEPPVPQERHGVGEHALLRLYKAVRSWPIIKPLRALARSTGLRLPGRWL